MKGGFYFGKIKLLIWKKYAPILENKKWVICRGHGVEFYSAVRLKRFPVPKTGAMIWVRKNICSFALSLCGGELFIMLLEIVPQK